jgi:hypothetical protein
VANPCRHCPGLIREGEEKLVLSYRPFQSIQPYAESGPIFLHEAACERYERETLPAWFDFAIAKARLPKPLRSARSRGARGAFHFTFP